MAKKKRSAKQLANDRRLRAKAKAGTLFKKKRSSTKRKSTSKRRTVTRVITKVRRKRTMVKRRSAPRRKSFKVPFLSNPTVRKVAAGVGMGTVLTTVLSAVGQPALAQNPAVKIIGGFAGGDIIGAASAFLLGGGSGLLSGGGNGQSMEGLA